MNKEKLVEKCLFCDPAAHQQDKQVVLRSDNFYLFAGLGPISEGYIIIAPYKCDDPKLPLHCFADVSPDLLDEVIFLRGLISEYYRQYLNVEASMHFEHGRVGVCFPGHTKHCFHAHLCCYPASFPLWEDMKGLNAIEIKGIPKLQQEAGKSPYLFIETSEIDEDKPQDAALRENWMSRIVRIEKESDIESQFLRKLIAKRLGVEYEWDWAVFPNEEKVKNTIASFKEWLKKTNKYKLSKDHDGIPRVNFLESVVVSNELGNDYVAENFQKIWGGKIQYGAIGRFLGKFEDNIKIRPRILDAGCGPGNYTRAFHNMGLECVGIDISADMLRIAKRVLQSDNTANSDDKCTPDPELYKMSAFDPKFPRQSFDGIWYSAVIVHLPRRQVPSTLGKLYHILKENGLLYISALMGTGSLVRREGRIFYFYADDELKKFFDDAGFSVIEEWGGETDIGSQGDTRKKSWRHYILRKARDKMLSGLGERVLLKRIKDDLTPTNTLIAERRMKSGTGNIRLGIGDDCAVVSPLAGEEIAVTIDPCPMPVISILDGIDYKDLGWFSMIINLSDLGSMGASPIGMNLAIEAPADMLAKDFDRFYEGIKEAAIEFDCPIIGGNIKDADRFNCVGSALGSVHPEKILRRDAARPGERVVVLGEMGTFWAGVIHRLESIYLNPDESTKLMKPLKRPWPRLKEGRILAEQNLSRCGMDSSDGLIGAFYEIASSSKNVDLVIDLSDIQGEHLDLIKFVCEIANIDYRKVLLAWGNWELVTTVEEEKLRLLRDSVLTCPISVVGTVKEGKGRVWIIDGNHTRKLNYVASERFSSSSYFSSGIESYLRTMRDEPLAL